MSENKIPDQLAPTNLPHWVKRLLQSDDRKERVHLAYCELGDLNDVLRHRYDLYIYHVHKDSHECREESGEQ